MPYRKRRKHQFQFGAWLRRDQDDDLIELIETLHEQDLTYRDILWNFAVAYEEMTETLGRMPRPVDPNMADVYDLLKRTNDKLDAMFDVVESFRNLDLSKIQMGDSGEVARFQQTQEKAQLLDGIAENYTPLQMVEADDDDDEGEWE